MLWPNVFQLNANHLCVVIYIYINNIYNKYINDVYLYNVICILYIVYIILYIYKYIYIYMCIYY